MIRRVAALLLIATSAWLLYQTTEQFHGANLERDLQRILAHPNTWMPLIGGLLGLLGGLTVFFGGAGGGVIAVIGGGVAVAYAFMVGGGRPSEIWEDERVVGVTILFLALAAILTRRD